MKRMTNRLTTPHTRHNCLGDSNHVLIYRLSSFTKIRMAKWGIKTDQPLPFKQELPVSNRGAFDSSFPLS